MNEMLLSLNELPLGSREQQHLLTPPTTVPRPALDKRALGQILLLPEGSSNTNGGCSGGPRVRKKLLKKPASCPPPARNWKLLPQWQLGGLSSRDDKLHWELDRVEKDREDWAAKLKRERMNKPASRSDLLRRNQDPDDVQGTRVSPTGPSEYDSHWDSDSKGSWKSQSDTYVCGETGPDDGPRNSSEELPLPQPLTVR